MKALALLKPRSIAIFSIVAHFASISRTPRMVALPAEALLAPIFAI
jgi:hypothetical protein